MKLGQFLVLGLLVFSAHSAHAAASDLCKTIATYDAAKAVTCLQTVGTHNFDTNALSICTMINAYSADNAISCLSTTADHVYVSQAVAICSTIARYDGVKATSCLAAIAEKSFPTGSLDVCTQIGTYSGDGAIACMNKLGAITPQKPACPAGKDIATSIRLALESLDRYDIPAARKGLVQVLVQLQTCM